VNFWREPIFASDCITVRGKSDSETILLFQNLKMLQNHILKQATGSAQPHVYPNDIKKLFIAIPSKNETTKFEKFIIPLNDQIANNLKENQALTSLRDWLLPMLMNGQIKVE
jgi:type I restriction enzyme S subunit